MRQYGVKGDYLRMDCFVIAVKLRVISEKEWPAPHPPKIPLDILTISIKFLVMGALSYFRLTVAGNVI